MTAGRRLAVGGGRRVVFANLLLVTVAVVLLGLGFRSLGVWVAAGATPPVRADVIVTLGGDDGHRVRKVAEVFRAGYASTVLITGLEGSPPSGNGLTTSIGARRCWSMRG
jgi:hypothetical protein